MAMTDAELRIKSIQYRIRLLKYIKKAKAGHTGGSLSCVDILNVLYNRILNVSPENFTDPARDRYVQSKGHSVEALYVVLADKGFFPESDLETLCRYRSPYVGHPTRKIRGIEQNTGASGSRPGLQRGGGPGRQERQCRLSRVHAAGRRRAGGRLQLGIHVDGGPLPPGQPDGHRGPQPACRSPAARRTCAGWNAS